MTASNVMTAAIGVLIITSIAILSRRAALDLDSRGQPGWIYGILVLLWFPIGLIVWLAARGRYPRVVDQSHACRDHDH